MTDVHARAEQALADLAARLRELENASNDIPAANAAVYYEQRLVRSSLERAEKVVADLGRDLGFKSDLIDGVDQPGEYWAAFERVRSASVTAMNWLVALRRPELVYIALRGDDA